MGYLFLFGRHNVQKAGHRGCVIAHRWPPTFHIRQDTPTPTSAGYQELGLSQVIARISREESSDIGAVESSVIQ
jgi:hypothetical protein